MKEVYVVMKKCYDLVFPLSVESTKEKALKAIKMMEEGMSITEDIHYYIEKVIYFDYAIYPFRFLMI